MFSTSHPIVPVELCAAIIDCLGESELDTPLAFDQLDALKRCSLACKGFAAFSQPHIFKFIHLEHGNVWYQDDDIFLRFVELLTLRPHLGRYVRGLDIVVPRVACLPANYGRFSSAFLSFPNIQYLAIDDRSQPNSHMFEWWSNICALIIKTYAKLGTLLSLKVKRGAVLAQVPIYGIFSSRNLRTLHLGGCYTTNDRSTLLPISNITQLFISPPIRIRLSICLALPHLKTLHLTGGHLITDDELPDSRSPSFQLKELRIRTQYASVIPEIFNFFVTRAHGAGTHPFLRLEQLEVAFDEQAHIHTLADCLGHMPALRSLEMGDYNYAPTPDDFGVLDLQRHIRETFPSLTNLKLTIDSRSVHGDIADGQTIPSQINGSLAMFRFIAGHNVLESLGIKSYDEISSPSKEVSDLMYPELAHLLADTTAFPKLKEVAVELVVKIGGKLYGEFEESCIRSGYTIADYMTDSMEELVERGAVTFHGSVSFDA